jgi:hypothetical protein
MKAYGAGSVCAVEPCGERGGVAADAGCIVDGALGGVSRRLVKR